VILGNQWNQLCYINILEVNYVVLCIAVVNLCCRLFILHSKILVCVARILQRIFYGPCKIVNCWSYKSLQELARLYLIRILQELACTCTIRSQDLTRILQENPLSFLHDLARYFQYGRLPTQHLHGCCQGDHPFSDCFCMGLSRR